MENNEEKSCGNCCWFCFEDAYGEGQCVEVGDDVYPMTATMCNFHACEKYVSRQDMRHHMAVLLQFNRYYFKVGGQKCPKMGDVKVAIDNMHKYFKVFNKL